MKTLFTSFWRKSLGCAKVAILSQLEYRFNLITDLVIQPLLTSVVEIALWSAIFASAALAGPGGQPTMAGFPRESYLAYALWAAFFARLSTNWMYEMRMIDEIDTGSVNSILARPITFFEYYLAQFMGYKMITSLISLIIPAVIVTFYLGPTVIARLPLAIISVFYYLLLVYTISFTISTFAFFFNRVHSFTVAKNIALWMLSGELFPLDLIPDPYRAWVIALPFSNGVFIPVGYLTGRVEVADVMRGMLSTTIGLAVMGTAAYVLWMAGRRRYTGTGA